MKRIGWILAVGCLLLPIGCSKSDDDSSSGVKVPDGQTSFSWDTSVRSQELSLTGIANWTAKSDNNCKNWCYPVKLSDKSNKIVLWVSPNITGKARSGKVTITIGGRSQTIEVSQPAFTGDLDTYEYHLPVVFHVLYKDESDELQNAKEAQFVKILKAVNELYAKNKMNIVFEMAKYNDEGEELAEAGIIRHQVDFEEFDPHEFLSDKEKGYADYTQNLKKYINIYFFHFKQTDAESTMLGLTTLPILPTAHPLSEIDKQLMTDQANDYAYLTTPYGVCINNQFVEEWQDDKTYNPKYIVSTLAHELGHYLGLLHTFSEVECEQDDGCDDTHISDYENYIDYITSYIEQQQKAEKRMTIDEVATRTDCKTGEEFVADNILDYVYTKSNVFTAQQKARTRHVMEYGALVPGPKLIDYNTTGIISSSTNKSSRRAVASRPGLVQTDPCPPIPVRHLPQVRSK